MLKKKKSHLIEYYIKLLCQTQTLNVSVGTPQSNDTGILWYVRVINLLRGEFSKKEAQQCCSVTWKVLYTIHAMLPLLLEQLINKPGSQTQFEKEQYHHGQLEKSNAMYLIMQKKETYLTRKQYDVKATEQCLTLQKHI